MIKEVKSKGSIRAVGIFGFFIPTLSFFSYQNYLEQIKIDIFILSSLLFISLLISIHESIKTFKLKQKKESKLMTILFSLLFAGFIFLLLALKDLNMFVWNECYFTIPFLLFCIIIFSVSLITELRKNVLIYISLTGIEFVKVKKIPDNSLQRADK